MPENAQVEIEDALVIGRHWDDSRRETTVRENQLVAKGLSLLSAGMIPHHTNPEWLLLTLEELPLASLR